MALKAFIVTQTGWPAEQALLVFAEKGTEAKILGAQHLPWDDWLKLRANRKPEWDDRIDPLATQAYVATAPSTP